MAQAPQATRAPPGSVAIPAGSGRIQKVTEHQPALRRRLAVPVGEWPVESRVPPEAIDRPDERIVVAAQSSTAIRSSTRLKTYDPRASETTAATVR